MISHGAHTACNGGRFGWPASKVVNVVSAVGTCGSGVKLGWLAHVRRADVCVWVGSVGAVH